MVVGVGIPVIATYTAAAIVLDTRVWWWGAGLITGCAVAAAAFVGDFAPEHLRRRERGLLGERKTRKLLERLESEGWQVRHGVDVGKGDLDHLVVGPKGVFVIETKTLLGTVSVEAGVLTTRQDDDPDEVYRWNTLAGRMRSLGREVSRWVRTDAGVRAWVQVIVVVWGDFPQRTVEEDRVRYLHGSELVSWLRSRPDAENEVDFVRS